MFHIDEVMDKDKEISLEDAQELNPNYQIGDTIIKTFFPKPTKKRRTP